MESLRMLDEGDLKEMGLKKGARLKILHAL